MQENLGLTRQKEFIDTKIELMEKVNAQFDNNEIKTRE